MPWINHLPPVCWSTFGILVWNDSGYVNLTQWWYFFIIFEYILHISTPHIMVFCFPLPYFPLSTSALFFAKYSCTHIVYRRSLVTFYSIAVVVALNVKRNEPLVLHIYSISQEICTRFCCVLFCCGYVIVHNEFTWSIYPYSSGLLCWHWGNR